MSEELEITMGMAHLLLAMEQKELAQVLMPRFFERRLGRNG